MKIWSNWKYILVDHKFRPGNCFTHWFYLQPISILLIDSHQTKGTKERATQGQAMSTASQAHAHLPPFVDLPFLFSLLPTKVGSDTAFHWSSAFTQEPHPLFHSHSWHSWSRLVSPSLHSKPKETPLHSGLLSLISLFLSNPNQPPSPSHTYFCVWFSFCLICDFVVVVVVWVVVYW